jgi:hypothetical protein
VRLSRRSAVGLGVGGLLTLAGVGFALPRTRGSDQIVDVQVEAIPLATFARDRSADRPAGPLVFRAGLKLTSAYAGFGGLSGLWRSPEGGELIAISDNAQWLTASFLTLNGRLAGLGGARMGPILDEDGSALRHGSAYDTEALALVEGTAFVASERTHEVRRFAWGESRMRARGVPLAMPPEVKNLPGNRSLEALGVAPRAHALAGAVIAIAEQARLGEDAPTRGWILTGRTTGAFDVARHDGYDITDIAFLDSGESLLLERRYSVASGPACRIRRLGADAIRPGALADGPVLFEADDRFEIDNMEGIAIHRDPASGETIVTLVSDDNFSPLQRTLLLEFALAGNSQPAGVRP